MKFFIFSFLVVAVCSSISIANGEEHFKITCVFLASHRLQVKLTKASAEAAVDAYDSLGAVGFKSHLKEKFSKMPAIGTTCLLGSAGDSDWNTAVRTFADGYQEFLYKTREMSTSQYHHLYLNTERDQAYDSHANMFNLGF